MAEFASVGLDSHSPSISLCPPNNEQHGRTEGCRTQPEADDFRICQVPV